MAEISKNLLNISNLIYQNIHDALPVLLFWTDTNDVILGNNLLHAKAFGFSSPDELVGKSIGYFLKHSPAFTPELSNRIKREHKEIIQTKKGKTLEYTAVLSDGKEHTHLSYKEPLFDKNGEVVGLVGVSTDITELKRTQAQLAIVKKRSEHIFQEIVDALPVLLFWTDEKNNYLGNNLPHAKAFGFLKSHQLIGKSVRSSLENVHLNKDLIDRVCSEHDEIIRTKKGKTLEYTASLADNLKRTWLSNKEPLLDKKGDVIGVIGISMDITKLKETQAKLEQSNAIKKEFIASMSHDLRTPITGIMGMLNDLLHFADQIESKRDLENQLGLNSNDKMLEKLLARVEGNSMTALGAVEGLLHLCNEILETVRLGSHTSKMPIEAFDLGALVDLVMNLVRPTAMEKELTLRTEVDHNIPTFLFGSARYLSKSLLNLISNALKFTEKGTVTISIKPARIIKNKLKKGDKITLTICVIDTGIGIPKDKVDTIFEHFSRLSSSYKGHYKGYGLGLYTVKQYVEAMDGAITVASEEGTGTQFTLKLPFTVDDHTDHALPKFDRPVLIRTPQVNMQVFDELLPHDNTRVLLVEDTPMAAKVARSTLEICGCRSVIDWASTGEIALDKASKNHYDLILMDIGLPKMQGTEVTQKIRALNDSIKSKVPIVALTGHAAPEHKKEFIDLGMNDLIIKPANNTNMTRVLEEYVFPKSNLQTQQEDQVTSDPSLILDKAAMLKLDNVHGDEKQMYEYLSLLSGELKTTEKIFIDAYKRKDDEKLRAELHRVRGALTYVATPELTHTMKAFHDVVRAETQDPKLLEKTYQAAIGAIDHFQKAYAKGFK